MSSSMFLGQTGTSTATHSSGKNVYFIAMVRMLCTANFFWSNLTLSVFLHINSSRLVQKKGNEGGMMSNFIFVLKRSYQRMSF